MPGRAADGEQIVEDSALDLQHWEKDDGTSVIPFFTSLEALQQAVADEQAFVMMPARTLMTMTLGESLFLNPKLPSGKEFTHGNQPSVRRRGQPTEHPDGTGRRRSAAAV